MADAKSPQTDSASAQLLKVTQIINVSAKAADVQSVRLVGVDIVIILKSGERLVIPEGGVRAMMDQDLMLHFSDQEVLVAALINGVTGVNASDLALVLPGDTVLGMGMNRPEAAGDDSARSESGLRPLAQRDASAQLGLLLGSNRAEATAAPDVQIAQESSDSDVQTISRIRLRHALEARRRRRSGGRPGWYRQ
jgi:hypothetical protein